MPEVPWGNVATELEVDSTETTMLVRQPASDYPGGPYKTQRNGSTLQVTFISGLASVTWSLTPTSDGKTAQVRLQAFMNDQAAVFRRVAE